jgi:hypothetical protein
VSERARFIARGAGYTSDVVHAVDKLEALGEDDLADVVEQTHRRALDERIRRREATAAEIEGELNWHESRAAYLRRQLKRLRRPVS